MKLVVAGLDIGGGPRQLLDLAGGGFAEGGGGPDQQGGGDTTGGGQRGVVVELAGEFVEGFGAEVVFEEELDFSAVGAPSAVGVGFAVHHIQVNHGRLMSRVANS